MAFKVHQVANYNYAFDARPAVPAGFSSGAARGRSPNSSFVDDAAQVPAPTLAPDLSSATAFFKRSALAGLIDMLRNESPVSVTINDQPPGFVFVHTGPEPVGEAEA
jgi:hypothetical protein